MIKLITANVMFIYDVCKELTIMNIKNVATLGLNTNRNAEKTLQNIVKSCNVREQRLR